MSKLIEKTEAFVFELLKNELPNTIVYHNHTHTLRVFKSTKEIIENSKIDVNDAQILQLAALLHDVGYTQKREGHEEVSAQIARDFLSKQHVDEKTIKAVEDCILATKFDSTPQTELEKILRDADASHFGKKYFPEASEFLRKELELAGIANYTPREWLDENIKVLSKKHSYYTDYALQNWQKRKEKNLAKLILAKKKQKTKQKTEELKAKYKAQYKNESPERAIQSFYRTALRNHIKLSDIADTKANILLSVNAIIISVVLANLISKLDTNPYLTWPTVIFTLFSVISMVMSIIATRPNVTSGQFTKEDVKNKEVNLTFFGNFHKMKLNEFEWAINEMINDKEYIYKSLTKDLYFLGIVLERKYRLLRITYTVFMIGIIVSLIAFGVAVKQNPGVNIQDVLDSTSQINIQTNAKIMEEAYVVNG
ncbi:MAG: putative nucleotidyltransferase with HDIG domain [Olleya marilimosa]|jgi:putative nucleotidyltransferase with HDIG domain|uniref:Pycsar system effector family protein n=1 Tax=Olleya marilimosa TaxID=272164 RepID=UPI000480C4FB|nr:Pycsar system effector family protein [Olleya marilimosa]|tara:strand:+ start:176 stop:1450 length:1275 start_codon:yes stop_codon:yes gene_type:complete